MYRYIKSAQATASLAKKLSAGWRESVKEDKQWKEVTLNKYKDINYEINSISDICNSKVEEFLTNQIERKVSNRVSPGFVFVPWGYGYKGNFRLVFEGGYVDVVYNVGSSVLTVHDEYPESSDAVDMCERFVNELSGSNELNALSNFLMPYIDKYLDLNGQLKPLSKLTYQDNPSFKFFTENIVGSGLLIPNGDTTFPVPNYYRPIRVTKTGLIRCEGLSYIPSEGGFTYFVESNKTYPVLLRYAGRHCDLFTERQVINIEKSYTS